MQEGGNMEILLKFLYATWELLLMIGPWLLLGFFLSGVIHAWVGGETIKKHLGGGISSVFKATLFGIPLPVCSCGVIPIAASMRKDGAGRSSTLSFLVSTPTTGIDSILATYALMGPLFAIFRPVAALFSGILVGVISYAFEREKPSSVTFHARHAVSMQKKLKEIFRYGFVELPEDVGKSLLFGILLGGLITAVIPGGIFEKHFSNPWIVYPVVLLFSVPLYVCAMGSIPVAASLVMKGLTPGAALTFLIAGPATNTITIIFIGQKLGKKSLFIYLFSIILISLGMGIIFDGIWNMMGRNPELITSRGEYLPYPVKLLSALVLLFLLLRTPRWGRKKKMEMKYTVKVPDMHCRHCKFTIEEKISSLPGVKRVVVDLEEKKVMVDGDVRREDIKRAVEEAGYTVED